MNRFLYAVKLISLIITCNDLARTNRRQVSSSLIWLAVTLWQQHYNKHISQWRIYKYVFWTYLHLSVCFPSVTGCFHCDDKSSFISNTVCPVGGTTGNIIGSLKSQISSGVLQPNSSSLLLRMITDSRNGCVRSVAAIFVVYASVGDSSSSP